MVVIIPSAGLCNKLRTTFSYYKIAQEKNELLTVIWFETLACPGFFLDYFEPVEGIIFERNNDKQFKIDYEGCDGEKNYPPTYEKLVPLPFIMNSIQNKLQVLENDYIAVHVRRTDHSVLAHYKGQFTTDTMFFNFLDERKEKNVYIATDNQESYDIFATKYKVKLSYHPVNAKNLRQTSLENSIIDLFMCVYASEFMGSGWSSFSGIITKLRRLHNK
jgi:hypothetical protein